MSTIFNNMTVTLSKQQVEDILKKALEKESPGFTIQSFLPKVSEEYDFRGGSCGVGFQGFEIRIKKIGT